MLRFVKAPLHHVADRYDVGELSSTTGTCRNCAAVVRAIVPITVSFMPQVATYRTRGNNTRRQVSSRRRRAGEASGLPFSTT